MKNKFLFICVGLFMLNICIAQKIDNSQILTCTAKPSTTIQGGSVTLSGQTLNDGKQTNIKINVTNPDKTKYNTTVNLTTNGDYSYTLKTLPQVGNYQVEVTTSDNKYKKTVTVTVIKNEDIGKVTDALIQNFTDLKNKLNTKIQKCKTQLPTSLQTKMTEAVAKYNVKLDKYDRALQKLKIGLSSIGKALKAKPANNPKGIAALDDLVESTQEINENLETCKRQYAAHKATDNSICELLTITSEACAAYSTYTNVANSFIKILVAVHTDKVYPLWVDQTNADPTAAFAMKEGTKLLSEAAPDFIEFQKNMASPNTAGANIYSGLAGDILQFIADKALLELCGVWKGTMTHQYTINNSTEIKGRRETWWKYSVQMGAAVTLRYPKNVNTGDVIKMKGNLEGNATKFDFYDDPLKTNATKDLKSGTMLKHYRKTPVAVPFVVASNDFLGFGAAARAMGTPSYFNIPIDAEYNVADKKITIFVNTALIDFSEAVENRSLFLYQAVLPIIRCQTYPILPAQTTIKGTLKQNPTFDVKITDGKLSFNGNATMNKGENADQEIKSTLNISAIKIN